MQALNGPGVCYHPPGHADQTVRSVVDVTKGTCKIPGCEDPVKARGWCNAHWLRWTRYGDPLEGVRLLPEERFASYVGPPDPVTGCTEWTGARNAQGYGIFTIRVNKRQRTVRASRWVLERDLGPLPEDQQACHRCDNPPCVKREHLFPGTALENAADKTAKGRQARNRGELAGGVKLTWTQVREIRSRYQGRGTVPSQAQLAAEYGVTQPAISMVVHCRNWKEPGRARPGQPEPAEPGTTPLHLLTLSD